MPRVSFAACVPVLVLLALAPPFAAAGGTDGSHHGTEVSGSTDACGCLVSCVQQCSHTPTSPSPLPSPSESPSPSPSPSPSESPSPSPSPVKEATFPLHQRERRRVVVGERGRGEGARGGGGVGVDVVGERGRVGGG